jgi:hypothetical protein
MTRHIAKPPIMGRPAVSGQSVQAIKQNTPGNTPPQATAQGNSRSLTNGVKVSDHAIVRYLQWTGRINRAAIEREILSPRVISAATSDADTAIEVDTNSGARKFHDPWGELTYVIDNMTVITVYRRGGSL